jgi:radical SAM-linked protein
MDLNNIIQRGFRRAGVKVSYSLGFHPKMMISHPPALPLGMEGKAEWVEFKSHYVFSEEIFLSSVNPCMIKGVEFFGLSRLDESELSMNRRTKAFVYSLDLGDKKVIEAAKKFCAGEKTDINFWAQIDRCVGIHMEKNQVKSLEKYSVNEREKKLYLVLRNAPRKGEKPQDIVTCLFGLENPSFSMARERFLLDESVESRGCD